MEELPELFKEQKWVGEFYVRKLQPTSDEDEYLRFLGEINFSPENGLTLYYSTSSMLCKTKGVIYGILMTGERCSLIGGKLPELQFPTLRKGQMTHQGLISCSCLFINDHIEEDTTFHEVTFTVTNMQEFFIPQGYKNHVGFTKESLLKVDMDYEHISVGNYGSFLFLGKTLYHRNSEALMELTNCLEQIQKKYSSEDFLVRNDMVYKVTLHFKQEENIKNIYKRITDIADLFAILMYKPVYPESIEISIRTTDSPHPPLKVKVYPATIISPRTLELCLKERKHFDLPITARNIDLSKVMTKWLEILDKYSVVISNIQNDTPYFDRHFLYGSLVLYVAQLEAITIADNADHSIRFEYPITTYGTPKIKDKLSKLLATDSEKNLGQRISELRNQIAHVGKTKILSIIFQCHLWLK
ncbi:hypothetical protein BegalDRAFT_1774 [Beggiatoa alba B18LD]|uniref:ApeA N-terminal domain-containing protein n=1 Tax=Beggiatoa alba B18LD TaxID=395493 RepID=I3CGA7_9GAMM|nr:hypothetical protein [Beggiatoa alba]EIJ42650.1 hypothetical protein BegalDRAFT_1774 [Beggiatoa alba B18LD]